jgi:hypothetical protein
MVSTVLGSGPLRVASWRSPHDYGSTRSSSSIGCWAASLGDPGEIEIATSGSWANNAFSLNAFGSHHNGNHAKIAISKDSHSYSIFGDMNEEGNLAGTKKDCADSQGGRGGLFFVDDDKTLHDSIANLIKGDSAPFE